MALDKQMARTWRRLKVRLANLEEACEARERTLRQLAERAGVELDLTRMPTPAEEYAEHMARMSSRHLLQSEEVQAYLRESEEEDAR